MDWYAQPTFSTHDLAPITHVPFVQVKLAEPVLGAMLSDSVRDCPGVPKGSAPPEQLTLAPPPMAKPPGDQVGVVPPGQLAGAQVAPALAVPHVPVTEQVKLAAPIVAPDAVTEAVAPAEVDNAGPEHE